MQTRNIQLRCAAALAFSLFSVPAGAAVINDAAGDFLGSYIGPKNGDMDVVRAEVFYDGSSFTFTSTSAASIGTTPGALFVWGIDRGAGTSRFPVVAPGVLFDSVVAVNPGGTTTVRDLLPGGAATNLPAANVSFAGGSLTVTVAASLLPSQGLSPANYTVNLWPRLGNGNDNQISDFAPDNSNARVTVAPEPSTGLLLLSAGGLVMGLRRRSKV